MVMSRRRFASSPSGYYHGMPMPGTHSGTSAQARPKSHLRRLVGQLTHVMRATLLVQGAPRTLKRPSGRIVVGRTERIGGNHLVQLLQPELLGYLPQRCLRAPPPVNAPNFHQCGYKVRRPGRIPGWAWLAVCLSSKTCPDISGQRAVLLGWHVFCFIRMKVVMCSEAEPILGQVLGLDYQTTPLTTIAVRQRLTIVSRGAG